MVDPRPVGLFSGYHPGQFFDEMFTAPNDVRSCCAPLYDVLSGWSREEFERHLARANVTFQQIGITFTVYGDARGTERLIPFDPIPRVIAAVEWRQIQAGIRQRVNALNRFLHDVYHDRRVLKDGVIPSALVLGGPGYLRQMVGVDVPRDVYIHIAGIDIIRDIDGRFLVLEDNVRTPSGISYVLENRDVSTRIMPEIFTGSAVLPVNHYPEQLLTNLRYEIGITGVNTTAEDALNLGAGVCQDYAHLFLSLCRLMGMPARYVSGYLSTNTDGDESQQSHAWPEVLLPMAGWIAFDPTNKRLVDGRYVRVAVGRDYSDVPPVRGAYSGPSGNGLDVAVYVMSDQQ